MALHEQQWVTVQQKTFTKWYFYARRQPREALLTVGRLNSKLKTREIEVQDLVNDLSDGVRPATYSLYTAER
jgi:hypothetical protein